MLIYIVTGMEISYVKKLVGMLTVDGYLPKPFSMPFVRKLVASLMSIAVAHVPKVLR